MSRGRRLTIVLLTLAIGAWLAVSAAVSSATMTAHVRIVENTSTGKYRYKPTLITVHKGDKLVWNNKSDAPHTVTFNNGSYNKTVQPGGAISRVFKKTGTFKYHCNFHTYMKGTVTVT